MADPVAVGIDIGFATVKVAMWPKGADKPTTCTPVRLENLSAVPSIVRASIDTIRSDVGGGAAISLVMSTAVYATQDRLTDVARSADLPGVQNSVIRCSPVLTSLYHAYRSGMREGNFLVYDLGAEFSVSVVRLTDGHFSIAATQYDRSVGGSHFDDMVAEDLEGQLDELTVQQTEEVTPELANASEIIRVRLSEESEAATWLPVDGVACGGITLSYTRERFEHLIRTPIMRTLQQSGRVLDHARESAGIERRDLDAVILVGGASLTPLVRTHVAEWVDGCGSLPPPLVDDEPIFHAALGGAILASGCAFAESRIRGEATGDWSAPTRRGEEPESGYRFSFAGAPAPDRSESDRSTGGDGGSGGTSASARRPDGPVAQIDRLAALAHATTREHVTDSRRQQMLEEWIDGRAAQARSAAASGDASSVQSVLAELRQFIAKTRGEAVGEDDSRRDPAGRPRGDSADDASAEAGSETLEVDAKASSAAEAEQSQTPDGRMINNLEFSAFYPQEVVPEAPNRLRAYAHLAEVQEAVIDQAREQLDLPEDVKMRADHEAADRPVAREAELSVIPDVPGLTFKPRQQTLGLWADHQHVEFVFRASSDYARGACSGGIMFLLDGILLAEVSMAVLVGSDERDIGFQKLFKMSEAARPYQSVFISYSHGDMEIAKRHEQHVEALGNEFLRDQKTLRSGEKWSRKLLDLIDAADVFQLFWSPSAAASPYVREEWERALKWEDERPRFIRPVYWDDPDGPTPDPPADLGHLHFKYAKLS